MEEEGAAAENQAKQPHGTRRGGEDLHDIVLVMIVGTVNYGKRIQAFYEEHTHGSSKVEAVADLWI